MYHYDANSLNLSMNKLLTLLLYKNVQLLKFICSFLECVPQQKSKIYKPHYVKALVEYVCILFLYHLFYNLKITSIRKCPCQLSLLIVLHILQHMSWSNYVKSYTVTISSWLGSVPSNFGNIFVGRIQVGEWCSSITIYISIIYINLWYWDLHHSNSKIDAMLDHTMGLISAVYISCAHIIMTEHAITYYSYVATYVGSMKVVYLKYNLQPNYHAAFYIYNYLILFRLVHSWWTFPFKQLIGLLQRVSNNHKLGKLLFTWNKHHLYNAWLGELETTMLHTFPRMLSLVPGSPTQIIHLISRNARYSSFKYMVSSVSKYSWQLIWRLATGLDQTTVWLPWIKKIHGQIFFKFKTIQRPSKTSCNQSGPQPDALKAMLPNRYYFPPCSIILS